VNGGASAIASMDELLSIQQSELEKLTFPVNDSDKIPLFINGVGGVGSPYWLPNIKSQFIGEGTGRQKMIAVLESIAFLIKKNIDSMAEISAVSEKAFISGGLSNNAYLVGALMQLTGLRLCQSMDHELTIKGIAYLITGKECFTSIPNEIPSVVKDAGLLQRYHYWEKQMGLLVAE
jgi:glycerol kinase